MAHPTTAKIILMPSVKLGVWRKDDKNSDKADEEFAAKRPEILKRDLFTCGGCGMRTMPVNKTLPSGYFDVHHIDDDHTNNQDDNLITLCPFCHDVFHLGNAGARQSASAIWMPQVSQADLNLLMHVLFILHSRGKLKEATAQDKEAGAWAYDQYQMIRSTVFADELEIRLGAGMCHLSRMGEALAWLGHHNRPAYDNRHKFLGGVRIIPDYDYHESKINHFSIASNFPKGRELITASMLHPLWVQWQN
jgi:hypothetical protein